MSELVELRLKNGASVLVEASPSTSGRVMRGRGSGDMVTKAGETLEDALGSLGPAVRGIVSELRKAADWPDQVEVEFAIKITADANMLIARSGGEANFRITLRWSGGSGHV
uniref:Trypsin-co-occurring domain-containing protein n=1 Tax=Streptomyces sp. NBC_00049 TaxID=2903617 RepID=A0AAU2K3H7_9ACTN